MTARILTAATIALAALAAPALAGGKPGNPASGFCPPGLAKKNPPCVPPGLAKKGVGDYLDDDYYRFDEDGYRLPRLKEGEAWYSDGTIVYRADRETRRVIEIIRLVDLITNG